MHIYSVSHSYNSCCQGCSKLTTSFGISPKGLGVRQNKQSLGNKCGHKLEYFLRVIINRIHFFISSKETKNLTAKIAKIKPEATKTYMEQLIAIGKLYRTKKIIDVNIEDEILEKIASKDDAVIFMMNHSNQKEDPKMLAVLNILLCDAYKKTNKDYFPLPKIILNEDILKTMDSISRKAFENFGAVGIDANINGRDINTNIRAFLPILHDFAQNKCNIFIFPEGKLAIRKNVDLFKRFQKGVPAIVNKMLNIKPSVTVIPVGFAYGKNSNKNLASIQVGTPIVLKRQNNITTISQGDILKDKTSILYNFFDKNKDKTDIPITCNTNPVPPGEVTDYIHSILVENLEINTKLANNKLLEPFQDKNVITYQSPQ